MDHRSARAGMCTNVRNAVCFISVIRKINVCREGV